MEKRPDTIGAFLGLVTREGKLRLQMRTEKGSPITGISYKGDYELPGGAVREKDLRKVLTKEGLFEEAIREAKEELGIAVSASASTVHYSAFYRTIFENPKTGKVDWAFMTPVGPYFWNETIEMKRKTVDVNPDQLNVLGELNLIVSGKKRMWRMGEAAIYIINFREDQRCRAGELLTEAKPDWQTTELLIYPTNALFQIRYDLGLEEDLYER